MLRERSKMKPKTVRIKDGYDFADECRKSKARRVSRRLNFLVLFLRALMLFNAMTMVVISQTNDAPMWLYFTYQPLALVTIWCALLLGKQNARGQTPSEAR